MAKYKIHKTTSHTKSCISHKLMDSTKYKFYWDDSVSNHKKK
jgi:hypothetical protein